jgi:hypothetical protein
MGCVCKMDVFDNVILCKNCKKEMKVLEIVRNGFLLRAKRCPKCKSTAIHPVDKNDFDDFMDLKRKEFNVKMRMVGNSYAVSIPREIVDFIKEQDKIMSDMVRLGFEDANKLSLNFFEDNGRRSRVVKSKEVRVVRNNKPVFHAKQFYDSANPKHNKTKVYKSEDFDKEEKEEVENDR